MKTALFGGSFDPVHMGHVHVAEMVLQTGKAARIRFIPAYIPPHKQDIQMTPPEDRLAMLELMAASYPDFDVDSYEMDRQGLSYTIETARHFREILPEAPALVIGMDSLLDLHKWRQADELVAEFEFIIYGRPGADHPSLESLKAAFGNDAAVRLQAGIIDGPVMDVSSTEIRQALAAGKNVDSLIPAAVLAYINQHNLYKAETQ